ncbi:MAG: sensor domain-containing diguanylate cyclase [Thiobacillus sp.]|nr:sensor domain-containing diguanylate cyclase [Thiobacillus sp.]
MDPFLDKLVAAVSDSEDLESLVRPLLGLLESVTGLESAYLTAIDLERNVQRIVFARNTQALNIPEGLEVPLGDTLCKRALDEGRPYVDDVAGCWGDSDAARVLGITTYLSEPVHVAAGELYGTLCAASGAQIQVTDDTRRLLQMFSQLIARQLERDRLLARLKDENREYSRYALSDPLTGIPNRRALMNELARALANARRADTAVHLAFIDLDGFKAINDQHGHDAGDRFLIAIARALVGGMRDGDFVARYGGDEFVVFGPATSDSHDASRAAIRERLQRLTTGRFSIGLNTIDYAGASVGVVTSDDSERDCEALLARADAAMYEAKKARRAQATQ